LVFDAKGGVEEKKCRKLEEKKVMWMQELSKSIIFITIDGS
jgi:hypothetical protein